MPTCSFCKKNYEFPRGLTVFTFDGKSLHYCSSKCRRNAALKRDPKKVNWVKRDKTKKKVRVVKEEKVEVKKEEKVEKKEKVSSTSLDVETSNIVKKDEKIEVKKDEKVEKKEIISSNEVSSSSKDDENLKDVEEKSEEENEEEE